MEFVQAFCGVFDCSISMEFFLSSTDRILVTGSNGFIGVSVVENLLARGFGNLRLFVRPSGKLDRLKKVLEKYPAGKNAEIVSGDLLSREDCKNAARDVAVIIHLAAGFEKTFAGAFMNSALTTRNLIEAFLELGQPKRFVNISSFAVYSNLKMRRGALLDETCPLEDNSQARHDAYGFGKLQQEKIVRDYGAKRKLPFVILRPGMVYGAGKPDLSGRIGINTFGFFIHLGGSNELPLTFVDNCAEAIVLAAFKPNVEGEIFNVVDDEKMTSREFLSARKKAKKFLSIYVPYPLAKLGSVLWENYSKKSGGQLPPVFNRRRCAAEWQGNHYTNQKLRERLGWKQKVPLADAMESFLAQYK
jgi:nucleoside-diphosphate-sugar epimerase